MASPPRYKKSFSPIRNLEQRYSPSNLDIILQQQRSQIKVRKAYQDQVIDRINQRHFNSQSGRLLNQNYRLKRDNEILNSTQNYASGNYLKQIQQRDSRIQSLNREISFLEGRYQRQIVQLKFQNQNLKKQILSLQNTKIDQINRLRLRYENLSSGESDLIKGTYLSDIQKLAGELEMTKQLLIQKEKDFGHLSLLCKKSNQQYSFNLEDLISQNNALKNKLIQFQNIAQKQIREIGAKKELEKSRTQGILSYCKQNNLYIEKQVTRLADQLLKKNISIQSFNRQITKLQKLIQETNKRHQDAMHRARIQLQQVLKDKQNTLNKLQKQFKLDLAEKKKIQIDLLQQLARREHQLQTLNRQLHYTKEQINEKTRQIRDLKDNIQRKEEDHIKQISKVMSDSKVKRKSMKNLSSYSSLKQLEQGQGSSIIKSGGLNRMSSLGGDENSTPLPTVHEEDLAHSRGFADGQDEQIDLKQLVLHYQSMIQQLKKNKSSQLQIASNKIQSLKQSLNDKQQEILDILNRFSPLMEYKINKESLDQERKRKIQQHHRGDVDLLSVMLDKYGIVALSKK